MKTFIAILFIFLDPGASRIQENEQINWLTFEQLSDSLSNNPRKVLINFHTDWCSYCRKMHREVFTDPDIVRLINREYYAVSFDAESTDSVRFDGQVFVNREYTGRRRGFHELARLLANRNGQITVPTTIILDQDFHVLHRSFEYLSPKKLTAILE